MGVLNKGTGMALQIQGFYRIVNHPLGRIHLEQIEFEGGQANFQGQGRFLVVGKVGQFIGFGQFGCGQGLNLVHQIIRIDHRSLPGFHPSLR